MDPLSAIAGTVGILDVCVRTVQYLASLKESVADIDQDLKGLRNEIESLKTTYEYLESIRCKSLPSGLELKSERATDLWRAVDRNLNDAKVIVQKLESLLKKIVDDKVAKDELTSSSQESKMIKKERSSMLGGLKKTIKLQFREGDLQRLRLRLGNCQANLQTLLTALNLLYTSSSSDSTDLSLSHLSDKMDEVLSLKSHLAILTARLDASHSDDLRITIDSAAAVVSSYHLNKHFNIPQNVSSIYTGREPLLRDLKYTMETSSPLQKNHTQRRFVIYGLGGSGKTQFCCKFAQDTRENFWGVFWIDGSSRESARRTFSDIANVGRVEPNERAAKSWLSSLERPWLLIIDNADDPLVSVEEYIPAGERGFILITTRNPSNKIIGTLGSRFYAFEKLEVDEASDLLLKAAEEPSPWTRAIKDTAAKIAKVLGFLPLALLHAGKAIMDGVCSLDSYLDWYDRSWKTIRRARSRSPSENSREKYSNRNMSIYSTFEIIYIGLEHKHGEDAKDAAELLKMFSFLYREKIEFEMLVAAAINPRLEQKQRDSTSKELKVTPQIRVTWKKTLRQWATTAMTAILGAIDRTILPAALYDLDPANPFDEDRLRNALALLVQLGLTMHHQRSDSYSIHPLVNVWVRERPETSTVEQAIWCQAATNVLAHCILIQPPPDKRDLDETLRRNILPHLQHVRECQQTIRSRFQQNLANRDRLLRSWFFPLPTGPVTLGRREALEKVKFSLVYSKNGEFHMASTLQEEVRDFLCAKLGTDNALSIGITRLLVGTCIDLFRNTLAVKLQRGVLQACLNTLGSDHRTTLKVKDTLAVVLRYRGQFHESRKISQEVVADMTRVLGPDDEDTLIARSNLGRIHSSFFSYQEVLKIHPDVLERMISTLGPTHLETLNSKEDLAVAYLEAGEAGKLDEALELITQVVRERDRKLGKEQPYTLLACLHRARILDALGRSEEAEALIRSKLVIGERNLGENHIGVTIGKAYLSQTLVHQRRLAEAEEVLLDVIRRQRYEASVREDGEHPDRIRYLWMLLKCYDAQGKIDDAIRVGEEMNEGVATIGGEGLGKRHPFAKELVDKLQELRERREEIAWESEVTSDETLAHSSMLPC